MAVPGELHASGATELSKGRERPATIAAIRRRLPRTSAGAVIYLRLLEQAPATVQILRELVAGVPAVHLFNRVAPVLKRIDTGRAREPGQAEVGIASYVRE